MSKCRQTGRSHNEHCLLNAIITHQQVNSHEHASGTLLFVNKHPNNNEDFILPHLNGTAIALAQWVNKSWSEISGITKNHPFGGQKATNSEDIIGRWLLLRYCWRDSCNEYRFNFSRKDQECTTNDALSFRIMRTGSQTARSVFAEQQHPDNLADYKRRENLHVCCDKNI